MTAHRATRGAHARCQCGRLIPQGRHTQCESCRSQRQGVHIRKASGLQSRGRPGARAEVQQVEHTTLVAAMPDEVEVVPGAAVAPKRSALAVKIKAERTTECIFDRPVTETGLPAVEREGSDLGVWLAVLGGFITAVTVFLLSTV